MATSFQYGTLPSAVQPFSRAQYRYIFLKMNDGDTDTNQMIQPGDIVFDMSADDYGVIYVRVLRPYTVVP